MCQLSLEYRGSPLSTAHGHPGSLEAGDRPPDLPVTVLAREDSGDQGSRQTTLLKLMDPSTFTLFYSKLTDAAKTHAATQGSIGGFHRVMNAHQIAPHEAQGNSFHEKFGASSSLLLVRPDGYIAFTGDENSIPKLAEFCNRWLLPQPLPVKREESHA